MSDKQNSLLDSGAVLAAATAFLYCVSTAKYGGYLSKLQLDADVLDRNFQQVLYQGFVDSFPQIFLALFLYAIVRFLYSHAFLPSLESWLKKSRKQKRQYLKLKRSLFGKQKDSQIVRQAKRHTITFALLAIVFLAFVLSLVYFESKGHSAAVAILEKLDEKPVQDQDLITVQIDSKTRKLLYLTCGARNCAGVDPSTKSVHYFPQNGHSYFLSTKKEKQHNAQASTPK
ncbi:MAG: hypothetical protein J0I91_13365 [Candidatus Accumulibacter sp.]|nr:hypothetical protein [Accumulibacter sp.]